MKRISNSCAGIAILIGAFSVVLFEMCRQFATRTYRLFGLLDLQGPDFTLYGGVGALLVILLVVWLMVKRNRDSKR